MSHKCVSPRLSVIIVTWNSWAELPACIEALSIAARALGDSVEVIVIDNASTDRTAEMVRRTYPTLDVVALPSNTGFPKACNVGLARAGGEYVLLLNPDVQVWPTSLDECVHVLEAHPRIGVCGAKLVSADGHIQPESARRFPSLWWLICETLYLHSLFPNTRLFGGLNYGEWDHESSRVVPCIVGAFMLFRGSVLRSLEGLDESVFMYFEDIDVCKRVWRAGYEVYYHAGAGATHVGGASRARSRGNFDALKGEVIWRFVAQHRGHFQARCVVPIMVIYAVIRLTTFPLVALLRALRGRPARIRDLTAGSLGVLAWAFGRKPWPPQTTSGRPVRRWWRGDVSEQESVDGGRTGEIGQLASPCRGIRGIS